MCLYFSDLHPGAAQDTSFIFGGGKEHLQQCRSEGVVDANVRLHPSRDVLATLFTCDITNVQRFLFQYFLTQAFGQLWDRHIITLLRQSSVFFMMTHREVWVCGWCHIPSPWVLPALYRFGTSQNNDHMLHLIIVNYHCLQEMHVTVKLYVMLQHQNLIMMLFMEKKSTLTPKPPHSKVLTPRHYKDPPRDTPSHTPAAEKTWCSHTPGRSASS